MSLKITVSYTDDSELRKVIVSLNPITHHIKKRDNQSGKYKKVDITVKR